MNTIIIEPEAYEYLQSWSEDFKVLLYDDVDYFQKCCLIFNSGGETVKLFVTKLNKPNLLKFSINIKKLVAKGYITRECYDSHDVKLDFKIIDNLGNEEQLIRFIQIAATAYLHANLFLLYGNFISKSDRKYQANSRNNNEKGDKTIVFRPFRNELYAAEVGTHRSPDGVFQVRGHFRHYEKSGKVIWIEPFLKGIDEK